MRNKAIMVIICVLIAFIAVSCDLSAERSVANSPEDKEQPSAGSQGTLPCFGCHSLERFSDENFYPHTLHKEMGLHCNQCHVIRSHKSMSLNGDTCNKCHDLRSMKMSLTSMPVTFSHGKHSDMFGCFECHSDVFKMKLNSVKITMSDINKGMYCGKCHNGKTASSSSNCGLCH